jgi:maltooligosyltrehalose trehalohydrolase
MPFGAVLEGGGRTCFRLWAPSSAGVQLLLGEGRAATAHAMEGLAGGWHQLKVGAAAGSRYKFLVRTRDGVTTAVPDPASRSNPGGVHGASEVVDPHSYRWQTGDWRGRPFSEAVIYELHVGTFTEEGSFAAAARRLPELAALGVTALQLMPLAAFPGGRNWGYDGVMQFAPAACYGTPDDLKAFIDGAHALQLMVFLDVVYNHFGPEGNYLHVYCPEFFNASQRTPWGAAIDFDGQDSATVRRFFIDNALFWTQEYRFDGLRLDAVHAMRDASTPHIVCEIAARIRNARAGRELHVILENNRNEAHYLGRDAGGAPICATAQWNDDVHHSLHVACSGESDGYYADFAQQPLESLGRALAEGFAFQGEYSKFRDRARGEPSADLPPSAFVGFLQNHDMVGNRAFGDRIQKFANPALLPAAYACLLLSPQVPMLFMGEEFAASTPFLFFCEFGAELAVAVTQGRRREFKRFAAFADDAAVARIPDPNGEATFTACKLRWEERDQPGHRDRLALIGRLLELRRRHIAPHAAHFSRAGRYRVKDGLLYFSWQRPSGDEWSLQANFTSRAINAEVPERPLYAAGVSARPGIPAGGTQARIEPGGVIAAWTAAAMPRLAQA